MYCTSCGCCWGRLVALLPAMHPEQSCLMGRGASVVSCFSPCCCRCAAAVAPPGGRAALLPTWGQPASTPLAAAAAGRGQGHGPAAAAAAAPMGGTPHAGEQVGASLGVCGCVGAARGGAAGEGGGYTDHWRKGSGKYTTTYCVVLHTTSICLNPHTRAFWPYTT
jgi:hypothetical protein